MGTVSSAADAEGHVGWHQQIEMLAGLSGTAKGVEAEDSILAASSPRMRITLLRYRVSKKLLLWSVLLPMDAFLMEQLRSRAGPPNFIRAK
jgi:hypothetical protein